MILVPGAGVAPASLYRFVAAFVKLPRPKNFYIELYDDHISPDAYYCFLS